MTNAKMVKCYSTHRYTVSLYQMDSGAYRVTFESTGKELVTTESMSDFKTATIVFDSKALELDGN